jgi:RNA recognition motif-containing protein
VWATHEVTAKFARRPARTTFSYVTVARLFVGNLPHDTSEEALRAAFAELGDVTEVHVVQDRYTGRCRGFGFVTMATAEQAKRAVEKMNGASLGGRVLKVNEAEVVRR